MLSLYDKLKKIATYLKNNTSCREKWKYTVFCVIINNNTIGGVYEN